MFYCILYRQDTKEWISINLNMKLIFPNVNAPFPILARAALGFFKILENPLMMSLILSYIALLW